MSERETFGLRSVLLLDDHPVVALGVQLAFRKSGLFELVDVATTPAAAAPAIARHHPQAIIVDLVYDGVAQFDLVRDCRRLAPLAAIVVFSSLPADVYEPEVLKAGANRFVHKEQPLDTLIAALEEIVDRPDWQPPPAAQQQTRATGRSHLPQGIHLTPREAEIGRRISMGLSVARISREFGVSPNTIAVHRDNIRRKLNCRDTAELIARLARLYPAEGGYG